MKVVGTKLDDSDFERFQKFCTDEGISKSEMMRGLIRKYCDTCEEKLQTPTEIKNSTITIIRD
ncbi:Hypothetical protein Nlim_1000 [Candidatus Nitrosarchaeum limnium SFB1]|jgi:hypothetical protein|uniref:Ribbon-helix-helix protein CopG domain-containing protein n=1 Tax=Candidatus Nitrosarchaeum limnium SFB1 TaxID=886738 RepID=F3KKI2_9ARCH|nr:Hypothetical protein Nlim_1000 [Candidatus Nitrosarchaeum limnium SFB1]